jgi:hypothetical protein
VISRKRRWHWHLNFLPQLAQIVESQSGLSPLAVVKRLRRYFHLSAKFADLLAPFHLPQDVHDLPFAVPFPFPFRSKAGRKHMLPAW